MIYRFPIRWLARREGGRSLLGQMALAACVWLGSCASHAASGHDAEPANPVASVYDGALIKRQSVLVSDADRALTFWRDVLGFSISSRNEHTAPSDAHDAFNAPRDRPLVTVTLNAGPDQPRALLLAQSAGLEPLPADAPFRVVTVINANGRYEAVKRFVSANGLHVVTVHALSNPTLGQGEEIDFRDWDGNLIVVYDFPLGGATTRP